MCERETKQNWDLAVAPEFREGLWDRRVFTCGRCSRVHRGHHPARGLAGTIMVSKCAGTAKAKLRYCWCSRSAPCVFCCSEVTSACEGFGGRRALVEAQKLPGVWPGLFWVNVLPEVVYCYG